MNTPTDFKEPDPSSEHEFTDVTAKIRPLPENVVPSERFRAQMRRRLLKLNSATPEAA